MALKTQCVCVLFIKKQQKLILLKVEHHSFFTTKIHLILKKRFYETT